MALYDTVLNVVSQTAVQCGIGEQSEVYDSTDPNIIQMRELLTSVGRRLILRYPWLQTLKEHTLTTDGSTEYDLPSDFSSMVPQTGWNRTTDQPLYPASRQEWQYFQAVDTETTIYTVFKPKDLTLELLSASDGEELAFEYRSLYWVALTGSTTPTKDKPTLDTDVVVLPAEVIKAGLKYQWLKDKGFPAEASAEDFREVLKDAQGHNAFTAPVVYIGGRGEEQPSRGNAPATGYGMALGEGGLF